jgi:hypothetical protein
MNRYEIDEIQIARLKGIATALRMDNIILETLPQLGYDIESVIGECENAPIADDEGTYGKVIDEDDDESNGGSSTEEDL